MNEIILINENIVGVQMVLDLVKILFLCVDGNFFVLRFSVFIDYSSFVKGFCNNCIVLICNSIGINFYFFNVYSLVWIVFGLLCLSGLCSQCICLNCCIFGY